MQQHNTCLNDLAAPRNGFVVAIAVALYCCGAQTIHPPVLVSFDIAQKRQAQDGTLAGTVEFTDANADLVSVDVTMRNRSTGEVLSGSTPVSGASGNVKGTLQRQLDPSKPSPAAR